MKNILKKALTILLTLVLTTATLFAFGCKDKPEQINVYAPDGATALAIAKFINDGEQFDTDVPFNYNVVSSTDIGSKLVKGEGDIVILPVSASSKLYKSNADNPYKMVSVVTHGNLYIMSDSAITLDGLKGKVIGVIGQGLVPDLTFRAVLKANGIEYQISDTVIDGKVAIKYFANASDLMPLLNKGMLSVGLLPEPAATKLTTLNQAKTWTRLDLQELYNGETKTYPQAVMMVKSSVIDAFPKLVENIAEKFNDGVVWTKANISTAVEKINATLPEGLTPSLNAPAISESVIDNCKIYWQSAKDAKEEVNAYIAKMIDLDEKSAAAVDDDYFM